MSKKNNWANPLLPSCQAYFPNPKHKKFCHPQLFERFLVLFNDHVQLTNLCDGNTCQYIARKFLLQISFRCWTCSTFRRTSFISKLHGKYFKNAFSATTCLSESFQRRSFIAAELQLAVSPGQVQARGHRSDCGVRVGFAKHNPSGSCSASNGVCNAAEPACQYFASGLLLPGSLRKQKHEVHISTKL